MPRILSRTQAREVAARWNVGDGDSSPDSAGIEEQRQRAHPWFGREVDEAERHRVHDAAVDIMCLSAPAGRPTTSARSDAKRSVGRLLDWFDTVPGGTYQDRWLSADADNRPQTWCPELDAGPVRRQGARSAVNALIILGVLRPSHEWLFGNKQVRFWRAWTLVNDPEHWDRFFAAAEREKAPSRTHWETAQHLNPHLHRHRHSATGPDTGTGPGASRLPARHEQEYGRSRRGLALRTSVGTVAWPTRHLRRPSPRDTEVAHRTRGPLPGPVGPGTSAASRLHQ